MCGNLSYFKNILYYVYSFIFIFIIYVNLLLHQVITYRALNISCSILCGIILFWYSNRAASEAKLKATPGTFDRFDEFFDEDNLAIVVILFLVALIEIFLSILGTLASQNRNHSYMQVTTLQ